MNFSLESITSTKTNYKPAKGSLSSSQLFVTSPHYFAVPRNIILNSMHYFTMRISNKWELQQIALNHSSNTALKDFINLYKNCTAKPDSCLVIDATLA